MDVETQALAFAGRYRTSNLERAIDPQDLAHPADRLVPTGFLYACSGRVSGALREDMINPVPHVGTTQMFSRDGDAHAFTSGTNANEGVA
jgi:hypothetical protein